MELVSRPSTRVGRVRWIICILLFAAVVLSYIDRLVLSVLKPTLQAEYGWSETGYGDVVFWFQAAYGVGFLFFGRLIDKVGAKIGYLLAMGVWTAAHMAHALVTSTLGFTLMRIPMALGESGTYPAALAAASEWFPKKERALAIGIFNAGANVGAVVTPLIVPVLALALSWQSAFIVTGLFNVVWIALWVIYYRRPREHPRVTTEEIAHIESDPPIVQREVPWRRLLATRQAWAYMAGRFLIDPVWWMFLFWLPDFLHRQYGIDLKGYGPPLVAVYIIADIGSILGGWASSRMLARGATANRARKLAMLGCAIVVMPVAFAAHASSALVAVLLIGLACAGHQGFSANLFSMPADLYPRWAQGSIVGLGGFAGALGGMLMSKYAGWVLQTVGSYTPIFVICGGAYLLALLVVHLINPGYAPVSKFALEEAAE
ncbi:MFS transporter [Sphingosinicella ginsenosidimutans]|uniref:MFS transporter n=1 Tax=Allosphingosinicella ginsenosidimutans TaxID=1176539 RepID=A0A5C6TU79_9SPHN|nr:MFS transporter [Sphingosinicella ginsenosidimutans]TXC64004.1 MFS transporter [Sphingosinicella ginsenosidimutans]